MQKTIQWIVSYLHTNDGRRYEKGELDGRRTVPVSGRLERVQLREIDGPSSASEPPKSPRSSLSTTRGCWAHRKHRCSETILTRCSSLQLSSIGFFKHCLERMNRMNINVLCFYLRAYIRFKALSSSSLLVIRNILSLAVK